MLSPHTPQDVVRLDTVRQTYGSGGESTRVTALDGVTIGFARGTFTAVMGPSGSGKSTLLHCAAGLDRPESGTVTLDGTDLGGLSETALTKLRRDRVGFVFQSFNLLPALTALQNVSLPAELAGRKPDLVRCKAVLESVGLGDRAHHRPSELSGGQQQRVAIARAVVADPAVVFADEPTGALDSHSSHQVLTLMRQAVRESGQTIVMVTHDPVAAGHADRVVFLADGAIVDELADPTAEAVARRMTGLTEAAERRAAAGTR